MTTVVQRSLSGGELTPSLHSRVDQNKYQTGVALLRNYFVMRHGGASNRPGTQFIGEVKDSSKTVKLLPFIFNADQTYVLEFGDLYMRVIKNGAYQYDTSTAVTGATEAEPCVITAVAHTLTTGEEVYISNVGGMTELNNRNFKVTKLTNDTISLQLMDGTTNLDSSAFTTFTSGGTIQRVYTLTTTYLEADLQTLDIVQSADVITIVHPTYPPRELARTGDTAWTITDITFAPGIVRATTAAGTGAGTGTRVRYKITAIDQDDFQESLGSLGLNNPITAISKANPAVVTYSGTDNFTDGDIVHITGVVGMTQVNDLEFEVANLNAGSNTFELKGINSSAYDAWSSGGTVSLVSVSMDNGAIASNAITLTWTAVTNAAEYNVYREVNGIYGLIGIAGSNTYVDSDTVTPNTSETPPKPRNPFNATNKYPSATGYYQGRQLYANQNDDTERTFTSRSGDFRNLTRRTPLQSDDAMEFPLPGRGVNEIRHFADLGTLIAFTAGAEWRIAGNAAGILVPGETNPTQQSYWGSAQVAPLIIGNTALFVQARGSAIRDLAYDFASDESGRSGYNGNDLTIFSSHLFDGFTVRDWTYAQIPHSIVWVVRSDGRLLGLTYIREQSMLAWHQHDFENGTVEQVVSVPEGNEDRVYVVVKRTINSIVTRYVERFYIRDFTNIKTDAYFIDSGLSYNGVNSAATTMTLSGGTTWKYDETITLTSSVAEFTSADVGNAIHLTGSDGTLIRFTITGFTSTTVVTGTSHKTVPAAMQAVATATWTHAVDQVTGLWHLEGKQVSVFADGFVVANPNNNSYTTLTVASGSITLDKPYGVIHVGLPFTSDIETLDIDTINGETLMDKKKAIVEVTAYVQDTRGVWAGTETPTSDSDFKTQLEELKIRSTEGYDDPVSLKSKQINIKTTGTWTKGGRVFIRQTDPVPVKILSIAPAGYIPFKG